MIYPEIPLAQSIIEIFRLKGVKNIIISPGSRNAPLTIGFVNNSDFNCYSIVDERCAAFFALGIAQQTQQPTAVVCTSGSALLNYYPAFAEAFYSQIPLIVVSADRPANKIDIGDGQTIRQENVFQNHSLYNANLTGNANPDNDFKIQKAINIALNQKGPVHINVPFEEPLYKTVEHLSVNPVIFERENVENEIIYFTEFVNIWNQSSRKIILVGSSFPDAISDEITNLIANDESIVVLTENISNWHHNKFFTNIEALIAPLTEAESLEFQPEILITFGGMIISKRIKTFLRKYKPKHHWHIDNLRAYNTFECLTNHFKTNPNDFFAEFLPFTKKINSNYFVKINVVNLIRIEKLKLFLQDIPFTDLKAFEIIIANIPEKIFLQLGNSATIRYTQFFDIKKSIRVFCNRGTSGIDGSTSTAIGAAIANKDSQTVLITGDLSFFYDSNALWNNYIPNNFKIIIVNNGGGGIFRILPGHKETDVFNTFFETTHGLSAEHLAKMYDFDYQSANCETDLRDNLNDFYHSPKKSILEVFTPIKINNKYFVEYFNHLI